MKELPKSCPKCGCEGHDPWYGPKYFNNDWERARALFITPPFREWLEYHCARCGYELVMPCKDERA